MIQTNVKYMSDPARAERTVNLFINTTLGNMRQGTSKRYFDYVTDHIAKIEALSPSLLQDMSYLELACLIDNVGKSHYYENVEYDSIGLQMEYYRLLAAGLKEGCRHLIPIRLFMALPLKAFYACLERLSTESGLSVAFQDTLRRCSCRDSYTIGEFLAEKEAVLQRPWQSIKLPDDYIHMMEDAYNDIGTLLVDSFAMAFPMQFNIEEIFHRYAARSDMEEEHSDKKGANQSWKI